MTDSQRYYSLSESTLLSWFTISPTGDPCTIDEFSIFSEFKDESGELIAWPSTDTTAALVGSLGTY